MPCCPDPVALFAATCGSRLNTLLLESAEQSQTKGHNTLIVTRAALRLRCRDQQVEVKALSRNGKSLFPWLRQQLETKAQVEQDDSCLRFTFEPRTAGQSEAERLAAPSVLDVVRSTILDLQLSDGDRSLPPLCAGSFAYDLLGCYEQLPDVPHTPSDWPDFELLLAEEIIWLQHQSASCKVIGYVFGGEHAEQAHNDVHSQLKSTIDICLQRHLPSEQKPGNAATSDVDCSDKDFADSVLRLKEQIVSGNVFQVVPSRGFRIACSSPLNAYSRLRKLNPSPYMFYMRSECGTLFGASPESALTVDEARSITINPIAGTRRRGRDARGQLDRDLDGRLEADLRLDTKEVAEHMMLVDLARNDVARVSEPGSRYVDELMHVVRYSHVMHLVSLVRGQLRKGLDALHAYVATMNMGTLVGAPKLRAAMLLRELEGKRRGPYGGAVGYLRSDGVFDSCIVIRSALVKDGQAEVRAGAGVVYDSDPMAEAEETRRKAAAVLKAIAGGEF